MSVQTWAVLSGRLQGVGASTLELAAIQAGYFGMTAEVQAALDTLIASLAGADLLVMLTTWRTSGSPFHAGFPGGGLPFGTGVAVLTGNPADDAYAIAAGTGTRVSRYGGIANLGNVTTTATLDLAGGTGHAFTFVLTASSCQITVIRAVAGSQVDVYPFQDASPPRMITHPAAVAWTSTGPPTLSGNANAPDRFQYTVLAVDGSGNPTQIVGSLGATSGAPPTPITPPVIT